MIDDELIEVSNQVFDNMVVLLQQGFFCLIIAIDMSH